MASNGPATRYPYRRAKFGSLAFAMKNRHFGGECSWILAGKARKRGKFWMFACVPNPGKLQVPGNKAQTNCQIVPVLPMYRYPVYYGIPYASWGPIFWPFLRSSARDPTTKAARGTVAIRGTFGNSKGPWFLSGGRGGPFSVRGHRFPLRGDFGWFLGL